MTKAGAIAKAKRYAARINDMIVIERNGVYEAVHADYKDEFIEDGYKVVKEFKYSDTLSF